MSIVRREDQGPGEPDAPTHHGHSHQGHTHVGGSEAEVGRYPPVTISATDNKVILRAECCLEDINDLELAIAGTSLILQGRRETEPSMEGVVYHRRERGYGTFRRAISLPIKVEEKGIEATYRDGVLTVVLPRSEAEQPRQITVKAKG